jgi:hypothetical protein
MKHESIKQASLLDLSAMYAEAAARHGFASQHGEHRVANAQYKRIVASWRELRRRGDEGREALRDLMNNSDPHVQAWAASHSLEFDPKCAEAVLERLANGPPGVVRHDAEMTLQQWRAGNLTFTDE